MWSPALLLLALVFSRGEAQPVAVVDDTGDIIYLKAAAARIVSLAPSITELLFAAGAGPRVAGVVAHSDYPPAALRVANVGTYDHPNVESILRLKPDLVVAWQSGNPPAAIEALRAFNVPVFISQPRRLTDVPRAIENLGVLAGTATESAIAAAQFRERLSRLETTYSSKPRLTAFYEVWNRPLMSVGGRHIISDVLRLCGARNIFESVKALAPTITAEAVISADPEVIIASGVAEERPEWLDAWNDWPRLRAVRHGNLFFVPPDLIQRHTPRILDGAELICRQLDAARAKLRDLH